MTAQAPRIALFGAGPAAQRWAWALAERATLASGSLTGADAVVLAPGARGPILRAKEALQAGLPVLWACRQIATAEELASLAAQSQARAPLRFYEPFQHFGAFTLATRYLGGPDPFWRTLYLRMAARPLEPGGKLEEAVFDAFSAVQALLDVEAEHVTAQEVRREGGEPCALLATVQYSGGLLAQYSVGLAENRNELVAVTADRQLVVNEEGLCITSTGRDAACRVREREHLLSVSKVDSVVEASRNFVGAVGKHDLTDDSSGRWASVAQLWSAAKQSLGQGATVWVRRSSGETETPPLRLFEGGDGVARRASSHRLSLVAS